MTATRRSTVDEVVATEVAVVGGGAAGLTVAAQAAPRQVTVLTATALGAGGASPRAQGGIAAAVGADDAPARHATDTLAVASGLADPAAVGLLAAEGPGRISWLLELDARFERAAGGALHTAREAGHSRRRVVHAGGDATGRELMRVLADAVARTPAVSVVEGARAQHLVAADGGAVCGVLATRPDGRLVYYAARAVVLATGGIGHLFSHTTNPPEARGDGLALALGAGARLADLEFVQFHPTALAVGADPMPLLTEAVRGEGAVLVDATGRRFLADRHPDAELAPRDVVARAISARLGAGHRVFLDLTAVPGLPERFPTLVASCRRHGLDPGSHPVPVAPAAHYHMGGIAVDTRGRTSVPGLWACGEVACAGTHGANRLASNSLLEAIVFGSRVAADLGAALDEGPARPLAALRPPRMPAQPPRPDPAAFAALRALMWQRVGLRRDAAGLSHACRRLARLCRDEPGLRPLATVARLVAAAALARRESRGAHWRADHPRTLPSWRRRLYASATPQGAPRLAVGPLLGQRAA
ncbi:MAG TPA: L-aspartate oxidase [Egibacteraceae bacterium]|nr:L-aspartate oxidase [Egibacteraceae bacterium]